MNIQYKHLGELITSEQATKLAYFHKEYITNAQSLKKTETYHNNELLTIIYYISDGEDRNLIMNELATYNVSYSIINTEKIGNFTIETAESYKDDQLINKTNTLNDKNNLIICHEELDINSGRPIMEYTQKFIGSYEGEDDGGYCKFNYNVDGSVRSCDYNYMHEYDNDYFEGDRLLLLKEIYNLSDAWYNYYITAHLYPNGLV